MSRKEKKAKKPMKKSTKILIGVFLVLCVISAFVDDSETDNNVAVKDSNTQIEEQQPIDIVEEDPFVEQEVDSEPVVEELPDILTVENCEDLRVLLTEKVSLSAKAEFANKYKDHLIQFDGNLSYVALNPGYKYMYCIMFEYGDFIEVDTPSSLCAFMIDSTSLSGVGLGYAETGMNVTITTSINYYDDEIDYMKVNKSDTTIERR